MGGGGGVQVREFPIRLTAELAATQMSSMHVNGPDRGIDIHSGLQGCMNVRQARHSGRAAI